jgi:hypothetical protein
MNDPIKATATISLPAGFRFGEVLGVPKLTGASPVVPSLGPLVDFVGNWKGNGFNTIFRPDNPITPTVLPSPVVSDNILELNLTSETLSFSPSLGSVPNRGTNPQGDIMLNGVPYLQVISDITNPSQPVGIHVEPGIWIAVPSTSTPNEVPSVARMASIPHGTTIEAQGSSFAISGPPTFPKIDITPFGTGGPDAPPNLIPFASQTATNQATPRIPQDLTPFLAAGTITQAMLDDPNSVLRNHISGQTILSTTIISIDTNPALPLFGGGTDNIAFLLGDPAAARPNAQSLRMTATFWIETVEHTIIVPPFKLGQPPLELKPQVKVSGEPTPTFAVRPPIDIPVARPITFKSTQIQYSQVVMLNFNGLTWPHVSVATLVPAGIIPLPPISWV